METPAWNTEPVTAAPWESKTEKKMRYISKISGTLGRGGVKVTSHCLSYLNLKIAQDSNYKAYTS